MKRSPSPEPGPGQSSDRGLGVLWLALLLIAALLRLTDLATAPLAATEAESALAACRAAGGQAGGIAEAVPTPAPLLFHLNSLLFGLFDPGDGLARLVPALAGVGLVLTPLLLRRYLGRWGTLAAALFLALSPTSLLFSRTLDGAVPATLGVMLLVGCASRFLDTWRSGLLIGGGLGLAIALSAGSAAWGLLAGLLVALAAAAWVWREQVEWLWPMIRPALGRGLTAAGLGLLAAGTGLGMNPAGLAAVGDQFLAWLARFSPPTGAASPSPLLLLVAYEPLLLLFGLAGIALAVERRHGWGLVWTFWAGGGAIQLALMPARRPGDLLWVVTPLAGLAGLAVEEMARALRSHGRWLNEGLFLPISLVLWVHGGLTLARYARSGNSSDALLGGLIVLLQVLLTLAFGFAVSAPKEENLAHPIRPGLAGSLRAGGLSLGLILLGVTVSIGWGLTHLRPDSPYELLVQEPTAPEVRLLAKTVQEVATLNTGLETGLGVTFLGEPAPALAWALRGFHQQVRERSDLDALPQEDRPPLVIAPVQAVPPPGYLGAVFALQRAVPLRPLTSGRTEPQGGNRTPYWNRQQMAQWWLYRQTAPPPQATRQVALWVREDLRIGAEGRLATDTAHGEQ